MEERIKYGSVHLHAHAVLNETASRLRETPGEYFNFSQEICYEVAKLSLESLFVNNEAHERGELKIIPKRVNGDSPLDELVDECFEQVKNIPREKLEKIEV